MLVPAALISVWFGEVFFLIFVLLGGAVVADEWLRMIGAGNLMILRVAALISVGLVGVAAHMLPLQSAWIAIVVAGAAMGAVLWRRGFDVSTRWVVAGTIYVGLAILALVALRKGADGLGVVVFVFLVAWASDTAAFFAGRAIGGPKLWPRLSPNKTWAGAVAGLLAGVVFGALVAAALAVPLAATVIALAAAVSVAAQAGDLLESAAKRHFMVKDTSALIPGHGGMMDRVDGLIAATVLTTLLGAVIAAEAPAEGFLTIMGR